MMNQRTAARKFLFKFKRCIVQSKYQFIAPFWYTQTSTLTLTLSLSRTHTRSHKQFIARLLFPVRVYFWFPSDGKLNDYIHRSWFDRKTSALKLLVTSTTTRVEVKKTALSTSEQVRQKCPSNRNLKWKLSLSINQYRVGMMNKSHLTTIHHQFNSDFIDHGLCILIGHVARTLGYNGISR